MPMAQGRGSILTRRRFIVAIMAGRLELPRRRRARQTPTRRAWGRRPSVARLDPRPRRTIMRVSSVFGVSTARSSWPPLRRSHPGRCGKKEEAPLKPRRRLHSTRRRGRHRRLARLHRARRERQELRLGHGFEKETAASHGQDRWHFGRDGRAHESGGFDLVSVGRLLARLIFGNTVQRSTSRACRVTARLIRACRMRRGTR